MPNDTPGQDLLASVSGLAPEAAAAFDASAALFQMPVQEFEVKSALKIPGADAMNGSVTLKFPTVGDDMRMERIQVAMGNRALAEVYATLAICITKAPASWYSIPDGAKVPVLNLERLPDTDALADLFLRFNKWRESFR